MNLQTTLWNFTKVQIRKYWALYILGIVSLFGTHWIQSELPLLAKIVAQEIADNNYHLNKLQFIFFALGIILFRTSSRYFFFYPARCIQKDMILKLIERLGSTNPERYQQYSSGQIFQILSGDVDRVRGTLGFSFLQLSNVLIALCILLPKLYIVGHKLILAVIPMLLAMGFFMWTMAKNKDIFKQISINAGEVQNNILESYLAKSTIQNYLAVPPFLEKFQKLCKIELESNTVSSLRISLTMPIIVLSSSLSLALGAFIVHKSGLPASDLIVFSGFLFLLMEPLMFLSWVGMVFSQGLAGFERVRKLDSDLDIRGPIELKITELNSNTNSTFKIPFWSQELSLEFNSNWIVFIGKTGVGKSELLLKLNEAFRFKNITTSFVYQTPYLFNDTIEKNIFLGRLPNDDDRKRALYLLDIFSLNTIADGQNLLSLMVGENGKRLSGGQAKRLGLIRSLVSDAKVLIWDDPFSSVDLIYEKTIVDFLKTEFPDRTFIYTTHRLSSFKNAKEYIFLDKVLGAQEVGRPEMAMAREESLAHQFFKEQFVE